MALRPKTKKWLSFAALTVLLLGFVVYKLADRYLIEHIEVAAADPAHAAASPAAAAPDAAASGKTAVQSDDWNYSSDSVQIQVRQVEAGTGADKITYYTADVTVRDASSLRTAFAKNAFGRNIVQNTSEIAAANQAIFAVNGDYYGFRNDGVIIRNGTLYRDSPARDALALLQNGTLMTYDETELSSSKLLASGVTDTFSFGPVLVKDGKLAGDFSKVSIDKNFGNRSIQDANPRTGIGYLGPNHYLFIVVDGRKTNYSRGMTLTEFAGLFRDMGATEAYNLDGGGSSTMIFNGRVVNNPLGNSEERGVSDILYVAP